MASEICEEHVTVSRGAADLSGILAYPPAGDVGVVAVVAGPHPLLGGNLRSNVVRSLRQALAGAGCAALTFDYQAPDQVGSQPRDWSEIVAEFWRDSRCQEELCWVEDFRWAARALVDWCGFVPTVLVGYSFGCWVVARHAADQDPAAIVLVSPNPRRHDFSGLENARAPLLVVQSDDDFACGLQEGGQWFDALREPKQRCVLGTSGHFFRGCEGKLADSILRFLRTHRLLREPAC